MDNDVKQVKNEQKENKEEKWPEFVNIDFSADGSEKIEEYAKKMMELALVEKERFEKEGKGKIKEIDVIDEEQIAEFIENMSEDNNHTLVDKIIELFHPIGHMADDYEKTVRLGNMESVLFLIKNLDYYDANARLKEKFEETEKALEERKKKFIEEHGEEAWLEEERKRKEFWQRLKAHRKAEKEMWERERREKNKNL